MPLPRSKKRMSDEIKYPGRIARGEKIEDVNQLINRRGGPDVPDAPEHVRGVGEKGPFRRDLVQGKRAFALTAAKGAGTKIKLLADVIEILALVDPMSSSSDVGVPPAAAAR